MTSYTLGEPDKKAAPPRNLRKILDRTQVFDWSELRFDVGPDSLAACLDLDLGQLEQLAARTSGLVLRLRGFYPEAAGRPSAVPAAHSWLRACGTAARRLPKVEARAGVSGQELCEEVDQEAVLRATQNYAGRIKEAALDGRVVSGAYAWFLISTVLDGLRARVRGKAHGEAEALLRPFAPLLVLLAQFMEERDALAQRSRQETTELAEEVQEAREEQEDAEASLQLRGVPRDVPRETLARLAERATPAAPAGKSRTRRTRR